MLIATLFFSIMIALIKIAGQRLNVTEILLVRQLTTISIAAPVIISNFPVSLHTAHPRLQLLRVIVAFFAMILGCSAFIYLPFAEVTVIMFSKTFFVSILAVILLGEIVCVHRWGAIIVGFFGVLIIAWPDTTNILSIYTLMAIASSACVAAVIIILRVLSQADKPVTIMTYQALGVGLLMVVPAMYYWKAPTVIEIVILASIGIFSTLGQYFNILSLSVSEASFVGSFDYARLVYSSVLGFLIFNEWPEQKALWGAVLIFGAAAYTLYRERVKDKDLKIG